jgi:dihydropteroate synthase
MDGRCGPVVQVHTGPTLVMGVVNVSPDSFAGDGHADPDAAVAQP